MTAAVGPRKHRAYPPAVVRFYVDADVLGLAKVLVQLRNDVTYPGDPGGILHKRKRPAPSSTQRPGLASGRSTSAEDAPILAVDLVAQGVTQMPRGSARHAA